jgi:hypothetical protein
MSSFAFWHFPPHWGSDPIQDLILILSGLSNAKMPIQFTHEKYPRESLWCFPYYTDDTESLRLQCRILIWEPIPIMATTESHIR